MSRDTMTAGSPTASAAGRRGPGRHRIDRPTGVRCSELPAVHALLSSRPRRTSMLRSLWAGVPAGRHTWDFLTSVGGRPRAAFAIILSL